MLIILCFLVLNISFIFDHEEKTDVEFQNEESDLSDKSMYESDLSEDVDNADDLIIGCGHEHADFYIPSGNSLVINSNDFPCNEQIAREFTEFADKYRLYCSEDMSQLQPSFIEGEKHPSWLIEHLDGIKDTLEKELTKLRGDFDTPFELNYDDSVEEREIEAIRKMEEKKEDGQQNTHRKSVPVSPGSRLTIGDGCSYPPFSYGAGLK